MSESIAKYKEQGAYLTIEGPCTPDDIRAFVMAAKEERISKFDARTLTLWLNDRGIKVNTISLALYLRRLNTEGKLESLGIRVTEAYVGAKLLYQIIEN